VPFSDQPLTDSVRICDDAIGRLASFRSVQFVDVSVVNRPATTELRNVKAFGPALKRLLAYMCLLSLIHA
jgi:hypothetical protein